MTQREVTERDIKGLFDSLRAIRRSIGDRAEVIWGRMPNLSLAYMMGVADTFASVGEEGEDDAAKVRAIRAALLNQARQLAKLSV